MSRELSNLGWMIDAACKGSDPSLFMSFIEEEQEEAKKICKDCPVKLPCLAEFDDINCITSGMTYFERLVKKWKRVDNEFESNFE